MYNTHVEQIKCLLFIYLYIYYKKKSYTYLYIFYEITFSEFNQMFIFYPAMKNMSNWCTVCSFAYIFK